jgi:hypothetical protein
MTLMATEAQTENVTVEELIVLMNSAREHVAVAIEANRGGLNYADLPAVAMGIDSVLQTALALLETNFED